MKLPISAVPLQLIIGSVVVLLIAKRILYELTTGAKRRRMIRDNGCQPPFHYPHKGVLGKLLGIDTMREVLRTNKEGTMQSSSRIRNYVNNGVNTLQLTAVGRESKIPRASGRGLLETNCT